MKKITTMIVIATLLMTGCDCPEKESETKMGIIDQKTIATTIDSLVNMHGNEYRERIEKGVNQVASFWMHQDGKRKDFSAFCIDQFIASDDEQWALFARISENMEMLFGSYNRISVAFKMPLHLSNYDLIPADHIFGAYSPGAHFTDDMFGNKLAFIVLLNFPFYTLEEKTELGVNWDSKQWAYARMGELFTSRTPARLSQETAKAMTEADTYISEYNIYMGQLRNQEGKQLFDDDLRLITHWGLRDELKSNYADPEGLKKQEMIYQVMQRIIDQSIPETVINNPEPEWNPFTNEVFEDGNKTEADAEPDTRYGFLLNNFHAMRMLDPYNPYYPNYISRKFDEGMEIPVDNVEALFVEVVSSPMLKEVGEIISERLGRPLQPFDIWYDGFKSRSNISEAELDALTKSKYPDEKAFEADLPNILLKLGFSSEDAQFIASKVSVDPSRGAGHAWGAEMRSDNARLRTRVGDDGMDYKGYNIAIHEFGHNVEQTISLHKVDHYMINGVPNTAFTEALAFLFQKRDLMLLGMDAGAEDGHTLEALDNIWSNYEIMGVSLLDIRVWKWLYENPEASPAMLKKAVIRNAKEVWNKYYAPVFGVKDAPILAIYSHMIDYPLYLPAYPVGELIQFQVDQYLKDKDFAEEVLRIYALGRLVPQVWMEKAVGQEISTGPALQAAEEAIKAYRE